MGALDGPVAFAPDFASQQPVSRALERLAAAIRLPQGIGGDGGVPHR